MSDGDESQDSIIPAYDYIFGGLAEVEGVNVTPYWSRETSPEVQDTAAVEMGDEEENLKVLKQTRTAAKSKYTSLKKAMINILANPKIPVPKVNASEKEFQDAFKALNEAHSQYVAAKDVQEEELQDAIYMDTPIADRQEVETKWTDWHTAHEDIEQAAYRVDKEKAQKQERAEAIEDEERRRENEKTDAADRAAMDMARNKEALSS